MKTNECTFTGITGVSPSLKLNSGQLESRFSILTDVFVFNRSGQKEHRQEWISVICKGNKAKQISETVQKGDKVTVFGSLVPASFSKRPNFKGLKELEITQLVINQNGAKAA